MLRTLSGDPFAKGLDLVESKRSARLEPCQARSISELLMRARNGDVRSVGQLLTLYRKYLALLASTQLEKRIQPRVSPSDVVQETLLKAHRHFADFRGRTEQEFLTWLRRILLSTLAHFVERHLLAAKRDIRMEVSIDHFGAAASHSVSRQHPLGTAAGDTPSGQVQKREASEILSRRLAQLPPRYREVLVLRNIESLSFEDAAARLHRTPAATRMLWLRAIQKLRALYRRSEEHDA
jgi:RNA polymerase sigma-70 factor (ECF subfamily)